MMMQSIPRPAELLERYALVLLGIAIFAFFAVNAGTPQFATSANLKNILSSQAVLGILVIATMVPLIAGHIDLSVGPAAGLCSLLCAGMMSKAGMDLGPAMLVAVLAGVAIGAVNAFLIAGIGINSIVATLGTSSVIGALVLWYSGGTSIVTGLSTHLTDIGKEEFLGLPQPFWILLGVAVVSYYILNQTPFGRYLYSIGSSPRASELVGLPVRRLTFLSFLCSGFLAGFTGILLVAVQGGGNPLLGPTFTLPALAGVFLGATTITPGRYNVIGGIVAIFLLAISVNGLTLLGAEAWVSDMFNGVALLVGVGISVVSGKRRHRGGAVAMPSDRGTEPDDAGAQEVGDSGRFGATAGGA
jgi:ribose transport system permease protein